MFYNKWLIWSQSWSKKIDRSVLIPVQWLVIGGAECERWTRIKLIWIRIEVLSCDSCLCHWIAEALFSLEDAYGPHNSTVVIFVYQTFVSTVTFFKRTSIWFIVFLDQVLENRTKASCQEMEMLETLEELRELRQQHAKVDTELMIQQKQEEAKRLIQLQEEEDEQFVRWTALL